MTTSLLTPLLWSVAIGGLLYVVAVWVLESRSGRSLGDGIRLWRF